MNYYQINYDKLQKLYQINFFIIIVGIIFLIFYLVFLAFFTSINQKITCYGFINDGILTIEIENSLSDKIKKGKTLEFNKTKISYQIKDFGEYKIVDNKVWQTVELTIDGKAFNNEVGEVTIYYGKQKVIKYILELFK